MSQAQAQALKTIRQIRGTSPALTQALKLSTAFLVIVGTTTGLVQLGAHLVVALMA